MKCLLLILVLASFSVFADCQRCADFSPTADCLYWKRYLDYCQQDDAMTWCKYTCGGCTIPTPIPTSLPTDSCGRSTVSQSRIINGVDATAGAWPWIASLQYDGSHFCGATLLTPNWVITASHCVSDINATNIHMISIKLGAHNFHNYEPSVQQIKIKRVIMHPDYSGTTTLKADMAMIELERPAQLNDRVRLACLPQKYVYPPIGKQCYLAGWGSIQHPGWPYHILQQTRLPVVSSDTCIHQTEVVCVGNGFKNQPNGKQQPNACRGDSGGPLVCQQPDGRWQLEGVASYVYTYCKYYTGYSPVNKYLDWINYYIKG